MNQPLVSIIIPTYNRAHLIEETLLSITNQVYKNWECIVVDDGSSDNSIEVLKKISIRDDRFKILIRPEQHLSGGNGARNYGLINASGKYVIFFDSDDLMTPDHIKVKVDNLIKYDVDYVITKTKYLNDDDDFLDRYYTFNKFKISTHNFIVQKVNWLTYDVLIKAHLAKTIRFNEDLKSGQEYNYFSKLVIKSTNAKFIDHYVTLRRKHANSKQFNLHKENIKWKRSFIAMWTTYLEINNDLELRTKKILLYKCVRTIYRQKDFITDHKIKFLKEFYKVFGMHTYKLLLMVFLRKNFNKGYNFRENLKKIANA
ncbi:glycosyltransferase family 2 protein [Mesonia sp.]|uniref:glycosyltransferase family 2 protein n=1 Tax=Mesonia sp. TaxID=1960830 RepID=UPI001769A0EC|nr:glycosyltransferase family 2 protein [Mesonia sp.]HIB35969.1 glycosyltransferase family 2 protein [Mesonia sp.]